MVFGTKMVIRELEKSFMRHLRLAWFSCGRPLLMFLIFFFFAYFWLLFVCFFVCVCGIFLSGYLYGIRHFWIFSWIPITSILLRPAQQAGFPKVRYGERMRNETQEFREKWESGNQHLSKVKVPKLNPSQLHYTFNREWRNKWGVKL